MLKANSAIPLYKQLKIALKNDILNSVYAQGERIPSEAELGEQYGVSRITVRYALQELEEEGMLVRTQGKGTFVMHNKIPHSMGSILGFTDVLSKAGRTPERVIHSKQVIPADRATAGHLEIPEGAPVLELKRTMSADHSPVMYDQSYYPLSAFPGFEGKVQAELSTYTLLREQYGVVLARAHKRFNVELADLSLSQLLGCTAGDPLFSILKIAYDTSSRPVHLSRSLVLASRVTYVLDVEENFQGDMGLQLRDDSIR